MTQTCSRNVKASGLVRTTVALYNRRHGPYRIIVRYRTVRPRPGPYSSPAYPGLPGTIVRIDQGYVGGCEKRSKINRGAANSF